MAQLNIPITKAKGQFIVIDTDKDLPDDVYQEALMLGLKTLLNRGTTKVTKAYYAKPEELQAKAIEVAKAQFELVKTSKIRFSGGKAKSKESGVVMTEARRLAKACVKQAIKDAGGKISHYDAKEITAAANDLLASTEQGPVFIEQAKENLKARDATPIKVDLSKMLPAVNPKKVAAEAEAKKNKPLSAKQAGKTAPRQKDKGKPAQPTA